MGAGLVVADSELGELGVFASAAFRAGDVLGEFKLIQEITAPEQLEALGERPEHCCLIDGRFFLAGTPERYLNHSCDPNVYKRFGERIEIVARRDGEAGEELRLDYLINNSGGDSWPCRCGVPRCRGMTGRSFFTLPSEFQREYRPLLAPWFVARHARELGATEPKE